MDRKTAPAFEVAVFFFVAIAAANMCYNNAGKERERERITHATTIGHPGNTTKAIFTDLRSIRSGVLSSGRVFGTDQAGNDRS